VLSFTVVLLQSPGSVSLLLRALMCCVVVVQMGRTRSLLPVRRVCFASVLCLLTDMTGCDRIAEDPSLKRAKSAPEPGEKHGLPTYSASSELQASSLASLNPSCHPVVTVFPLVHLGDSPHRFCVLCAFAYSCSRRC
jgi:hypothetical protein